MHLLNLDLKRHNAKDHYKNRLDAHGYMKQTLPDLENQELLIIRILQLVFTKRLHIQAIINYSKDHSQLTQCFLFKFE